MKRCVRCVLPEGTPGISFGSDGFCNYCTEFEARLEKMRCTALDRVANRTQLIESIKSDGKGKKYDCVVGLSGGVDSSYVLVLALKCGLRPLAVHLDNGWNSDLAVSNIEKLVRGTGVDLVTHVIDWNENRDLQRSMIAANVVDIELLTDNAMIALNYRQASRFGVHAVLAGTNTSTEGMPMPPGWSWLKFDSRNIRAIQSRFGSRRIVTHPLISVVGRVYYEHVRGIRWISFLDFFNYEKDEAVRELQAEFDYRPYPLKHYESVFTRFYQGYILPKKFGIDKRLIHLSTLVMTGQMSREQALTALQSSPYPDADFLARDYEYVLKKLGYTEGEFAAYLSAPGVRHDSYPSHIKLWRLLAYVYKRATGTQNVRRV